MRDFNALQTLSLFGILFSVVAQLLLPLFNKHVETFWALYPTWIGVFVVGTLLRIFKKEGDHHH